MNDNINKAISALQRGEIILIYDADGREEETDMIVAGEFATSQHIRTMRKYGGGLICTALHPAVADKLKIPFLVDVLHEASKKYPVFEELKANDIPYDEKSSFSITVNHRKTFTGISDEDRSLTIRELANVAKNSLNGYDAAIFGKNFRSPGHVILLRAADGLLQSRRGHTELSVALMEMAKLTPIAAICEMLADDGKSMRISETEKYARKYGLIFLEGWQVIEEWMDWKAKSL